MLQDMDHMKVSCVFYFKVGTLDQMEHCKMCIMTVTTLGIASVSNGSILGPFLLLPLEGNPEPVGWVPVFAKWCP